ncbi:hypothetical protein [Allorhizocola rhizosphaerae]|uniref:hypothetical protein n=1 Tax=Allorhizocola rhizosphaerae TaxID=1872709 RepID=UPI0013C30684|nr:hypothetical protein [Allorhizocola rhizosphaerae]
MASIATMVAATILIGTPTAAQAHDVSKGGPWSCGWSGVSYCGYGGVGDGHTYAYACDVEADGQGYFIEWARTGASGRVGDPNGSASGCGGASVGTIHRFRMCTWVTSTIAACTEWVTT